jgi:hypothetical protein
MQRTADTLTAPRPTTRPITPQSITRQSTTPQSMSPRPAVRVRPSAAERPVRGSQFDSSGQEFPSPRDQRAIARSMAFANGRTWYGRALPLAAHRTRPADSSAHSSFGAADLQLFDGDFAGDSAGDFAGGFDTRATGQNARADRSHLLGDAVVERRARRPLQPELPDVSLRPISRTTRSAAEGDTNRVEHFRPRDLAPINRATPQTDRTRPLRLVPTFGEAGAETVWPPTDTGVSPSPRVAAAGGSARVAASKAQQGAPTRVAPFTTATALALALVPTREEGGRGVQSQLRPDLTVVTPASGRSVRTWILVGCAVLASVLFAAVALHASLAQRQQVIDTNNTKIAESERVHDRLRVEVARLESPARIAAEADRLGLRAPATVRFVNPNDTKTGGLTIVDAGETPLSPSDPVSVAPKH